MTVATQAFLTELKQLASTTVSIRANNGLNNYGEPGYVGAATSYSAYVQKVEGSNSTVEMDRNVVKYRAYIPSATLTVTMEDELTFADGIVRPIIEIDYRWDEFGQQFVVLSVGSP